MPGIAFLRKNKQEKAFPQLRWGADSRSGMKKWLGMGGGLETSTSFEKIFFAPGKKTDR
jgi:hypothetical protein